MGNILKNSDINVNFVKPLPIPRRPKFLEKMSPQEFDRQEREAFLNWRRALAMEEDKNINFAITPFEKNIEIWRQLWMVVDKSDMLVQIVDGRNPLYFRCDDLELYIKEINPKKETVLLINKADLMSIPVRKHWADYFQEKNINYVFFSAKKENDIMTENDKLNMINLNDDEEVKKKSNFEVEDDFSDDEDLKKTNKNQFQLLDMINDDNDDMEVIENLMENKIGNIQKSNDKVTEEVKKAEIVQKDVEKNNKNEMETTEQNVEEEDDEEENELNKNIDVNNEEEIVTDDLEILNREKLIKYLKSKVSSIETKVNYNIGFVGFPNVGKSSVINVIMNEKKV